MSSQEKNLYAVIISTIIVSCIYAFMLFGLYQDGLFDSENASTLVGKYILLFIVANALAGFITKLLFTAIYAMVTKECETEPLDERDKLIELHGMQLSYAVCGGCIILSFLSLYLGWPSWLVFNLLCYSIVVGELVGNVFKLAQYRRGY